MRRIENLGGKLCGLAMTLLIAAGAAQGVWRDAQPKFHDLTISAGDALPAVTDFANNYAVPEKCAEVTGLSDLDANAAGEYEIVLRHGAREETVTLQIVDILPPELEVKDLEVAPDVEITPELAVVRLWDHSQVTLSFDRDVKVPADYSPFVLGIIAEDACGNVSRAFTTVQVRWLLEQATLEYGQSLTRDMVLYAPEKDAALITDEALAEISSAPLGTYELSSTSGSRTLCCLVTVQDTTGPVLELKEHQVYVGGKVKLQDFLVSATDPSGEVTLTMLTEPDTSAEGSCTVVIEARDIHGNVTTGETTLYVVTDVTPPVIYGAGSELTVDKHSSPNYLKGVYATDSRDGDVGVSVDSSKVNTDVAGTYVVIYTARDNSGNVATVRRKVVVKHDAEDTAALVRSIADKQPNDPELIRDYVRSSISYNHNWGGDDPVWYGFTQKRGNCYVHAMCLKSIFDVKGYNSRLIWVTDKSHYWLILEVSPGVWRHIDATPSNLHGRYSLMTDEQRYWTLSGRDWDRSQWPVCE